MLSPQFVNAKDLRVAIGEINSTGLLEEKIRTVGVKKEVLYDSFLKAVQSIPEEEEGKIAEKTIVFFNSIVNGEDPSEEEQKAAAEKKAKKSAPKGPSNEQKGYDLMKAGASDEEWNKVYGEYYAKKNVTDEKFIASRIAIYKNIAKKRLAKEGTPVDEPAKAEPAKKAAPKKTAAKRASAKTEEAAEEAEA